MARPFIVGFLPFVPVAAVGISLIVSCGCGSGGSTSTTPPLSAFASPTPDQSISTTRHYEAQNLVLTLTLAKQNYAAGEVVPVRFTAKNTGTTDIVCLSQSPYYTSGEVRVGADPYDNIVNFFKETGASAVGVPSAPSVVADWEPAPPLYPIRLAAGETRTFFLQWDQTYRPDLSGKPVAPGTYFVRVYLGFTNINGVSSSTTFTTDGIGVTIR